MNQEAKPKMLRLVLKLIQFLVVFTCVLAIVVIPSPPDPLYSLYRSLGGLLIVCLLIIRPVREIIQGFMNGWRGTD